MHLKETCLFMHGYISYIIISLFTKEIRLSSFRFGRSAKQLQFQHSAKESNRQTRTSCYEQIEVRPSWSTPVNKNGYPYMDRLQELKLL
jgi:hypothetical protein